MSLTCKGLLVYHIGMDYEKRKLEIAKYYSQGMTDHAISKIYNVSTQRIQQIRTNYKNPNIKIVKPQDHKIYTSKKREYMNIPSVKVEHTPSLAGGRAHVCELVRIRDNHTCQKCGKKWVKDMRRFDVHHNDEKKDGKSRSMGIIQWNYKNFNKLVTLCHKCHFNLDMTRRKMYKMYRKTTKKLLTPLFVIFVPLGYDSSRGGSSLGEASKSISLNFWR